MTATEFADLQTIAANLENGISTSTYVDSIFYQLVDGSAANTSWTAGNTANSGKISTLGNLAAGTSSTHLNELIGTWFLGANMPDPTIPGSDTQSGKPAYPTYTAYNYALFGTAGVPQISDIAQGSVGDCELCSGIIETLLNHPSIVNSMFVSDGNGVYGVRFYVNGTETWVTVNDQLPVYNGSLVFNNAYVTDPTQGLWVDLVEKAYAQLSATGQIDHPATNSYANIEADAAFDVLTNLTNTSDVQYFFSSSANWNNYKTMIINAVNQHDDVVLETGNNVTGTFDSSNNQLLVTNHAYAVVGYDSATGDFIVHNPWGTESGNPNYVTQFEVSMSDIASSAVQGDFVVDNSAAPNVVFTAPQLMIGLTSLTYTSFQARDASLGANLTVSLAPLFQVQDTAGAAVTQYMFEITSASTSGRLNLNGATNLATAAQQAAGEVVVSSADLSKLTLTTGAAGSKLELYLSGNDGTGFSTPMPMSFDIDTQGITLLPVSNPMSAPSQALSVSSLFSLAGATSSSMTYTIEMDAGLGTINLNGATNLSSSSTKVEVSAADLAKVTYTTPSTSGIAVLDIGVGSSSTASDLTQVEIDVGYSVAAALQDFKTGTTPYQIGVADKAATIFANLDALQTMMPAWNLLGVLVDDATKQTETISVSQFVADAGVLSILSGNITLDVSGVTVAQAQSILGNSSNHVAGVQVADSSADIFANLSALETMAAAGEIAGITLTDANSAVESVTTAQLSTDASVLNDIAGSYSLAISGSAASVTADLSNLQTLAAKGALGSVTLTDSGTPTLSITASQLTADNTALSDISGSFSLSVAAGSSAVTISGLAGHATTVDLTGNASQYSIATADGVVSVTSGGITDHLSNIAAIQFADVTAIVAATPGPANAVTTGNVTELYSAVLDRVPDVGGLTFYQTYLKNNPTTPLQQFAEFFLNSKEYTSAHSYAQSTAGDEQFITDSYTNLLHRTPSASEVSFYETNVLAPAVANLTPGTTAYANAALQAHALMLVYFSASAEFLSDVQVTAANPVSAQHWLVLT